MNACIKLQERIILGNLLSNKLAGDVISRIKLFYLPLWISIRKKFRLRKGKSVKIKIKKNGSKFDLFISDNGDIDSLSEIFLNEEYKFQAEISPKIIFDVGSNAGISAIYFSLQYPGAKIYCFEPSPQVFNKLKNNVIQFGNIFVFNAAVTGKDGRELFYISPYNSLFSSLIQVLPNQTAIEIEGKTLDSLMAELMIEKIDLLKFDIEGAELEVFKNFKNISRVKNLIGELHLDLINGEKNDFLNIFSEFKIDLEKRSSQIYMFRAIKNANQFNNG